MMEALDYSFDLSTLSPYKLESLELFLHCLEPGNQSIRDDDTWLFLKDEKFTTRKKIPNIFLQSFVTLPFNALLTRQQMCSIHHLARASFQLCSKLL